ncbi:MAG: 3'-5' exonuclease, partial [Tannerellaceae bacterium]
IYALLFHKRISKGQRLTNWEAEILTEPQKRYASLDAWSCLKIYEKLQEKKEHDRLSSFK